MPGASAVVGEDGVWRGWRNEETGSGGGEGKGREKGDEGRNDYFFSSLGSSALGSSALGSAAGGLFSAFFFSYTCVKFVSLARSRLQASQTHLLEEGEGSLLGLGNLLLDLRGSDARRVALRLDGELAELGNEALDLLGVSGVNLLAELLDGLVGLGGDRVGRVGSLDELAALRNGESNVSSSFVRGENRNKERTSLSASACCSACSIMLSISLSESPEDAAMVMLWSLLVALSLAETLTIPSASMSKVTSTWGIPLGAGGMPTSWKLPRSLLSRTSSRSP